MDFYKRKLDQYTMGIDHPPKNKKERRKYVTKPARNLNKKLIRQELKEMDR